MRSRADGPPRKGEPSTLVRGLTVDVGEHRLVSDIDLDLSGGTITTLVGPSGAGKSVTAGAVAGALPATHHVQGSLHPIPRHAVGYLPQDGAATLNPARRIGTALAELVFLHDTPPRRGHGRGRWVRSRVEELLQSVAFPVEGRLVDFWRRYPFEFSGGQRTRLALAQVLSTRPGILVLDEPTTGLDPLSRAEVMGLLERQRSAGRAVLLVTHDEMVAGTISDHVHHMTGGRLLPSSPARATTGASPPRSSMAVHRRPVTPALVVVDGVTVRSRNTPLLRDASLTVDPGTSLAIVGASGAGKTTLARAVAGLVPLTSGTVAVNGETLPTLSRRSRRQRAQVQYVWQETRESFEPARPVQRQVARTAVRLRGVSPREASVEAAETLQQLGLTRDQVQRVPSDLSGGQLRRAALARALLAKPHVLVCDEITTGLDPESARVILDQLGAHRRALDASVLLLGHDLRLLLPHVHEVLALDRGQVTDHLTVEAHWASTVSPTLAGLLHADGVPV